MGDLKNYTNFVKTYKKSIKIFIGKDINNKYFNGNSILLKIKINTYVFIQYSIIKFTTPNNDEFIKFISPIGGNNIPYPFGLGRRNVYSF